MHYLSVPAKSKSNLFISLGNAITWYRAEANMYRWLETFEQQHVELQRYILHCSSMSRIWTSAASEVCIDELARTSSEVAALRARATRQAAIFDDLGGLARAKFTEVGHPAFVNFEVHLAGLVVEFREDQLKWMSDLDIVRADVVRGLILIFFGV